ncbi:hypothetical protein, partial [Burkholderia ambifaria]|uniref:hypothetical protein n=1 Tax=Burkholderia ambifaria TaxID=152480 RepID=UPI00158F36DD
MTKTAAELQSELDRLDAEIRITLEQEVGGPLDQITELMAQWSISLDQVARHFRHRFGMEASDTSLRRTDLSVISWARHIMRCKGHGYANEEETANCSASGSGP